MLTTEVGTLVYNYIQHCICLRIEFYPSFDRSCRDQPDNQVVFTFQYPRYIQSTFYRKYYFWYQLWVPW